MRAGAVDFVEKPFAEKEILAAVDRAREHQVMHLLVGGRQKKSIAYELGISPAASRSIACASLEKTRARNLSKLVRWAIASCTS